MRSGKNAPFTSLNSRELVPGDIVEIPEVCVLPCDIVLLSGSCIVNECMLTGESIPVIKNEIPHTEEKYDAVND
jgi:cation-transporting ATPase 13A3/4/5